MTAAADHLRILLADDHFVVRLGLADLLSTEPGFSVIGQASDGVEAVEMFARLRPDVMVLDWELPRLTGPEVVASIRRDTPEARLMILSVHDSEEAVWRAVEAGASGYVLKSARREDLIAAIRAVAAGGEFFPPAIAARLRARQARTSLTARENDVLACVVEGLANKEIAGRLGLAEPTVKMHLVSLFEKLGARDRTQAAMLAVRRGLIRPPG